LAFAAKEIRGNLFGIGVESRREKGLPPAGKKHEPMRMNQLPESARIPIEDWLEDTGTLECSAPYASESASKTAYWNSFR
jgi:hypothetical protein